MDAPGVLRRLDAQALGQHEADVVDRTEPLGFLTDRNQYRCLGARRRPQLGGHPRQTVDLATAEARPGQAAHLHRGDRIL